ncbi:MAG: 50S ribosomal protein L13 [bacterium]|nr:50S ribosomal protein L13 [bacterium]
MTRSLTTEEARDARHWFIADADGQVLGRLASRVARVLRGKEKPGFTPHADTGDFVVIVNAEKIRLTGKKLADKVYRRHSEYPGGLRSATAAEVLAKQPTRIIHEAVEGMLPKNRLGRQLATKLKVYAGSDHPHRAQKPDPLP